MTRRSFQRRTGKADAVDDRANRQILPRRCQFYSSSGFMSVAPGAGASQDTLQRRSCS